jgi:cyclic-di-AMP phosphodiesterase PgpH
MRKPNFYAALPWLVRATYFILAAALVVWIFPREGRFKYSYQAGRPWVYEDLFAPFDFPIRKSAAELLSEHKRIQEKNRPIFRFDEPSYLKARADLNIELRTLLEGKRFISDKRAEVDIATMLEAYDSVCIKGVMRIPEDDPDFRFLRLDNDVLEERRASGVFSMESAWLYIKSKLPNATPVLQAEELALFRKHLIYTLVFDEEMTNLSIASQLAEIPENRGMMREMERIVSKGEVVDDATFQILESLRFEHERGILSTSGFIYVLLGQSILVLLAFLMLFLFLLTFRSDILLNHRKLVLNILLLTLMVLCAAIAARINTLYLYAVPLCIVPVIIRSFFDTRLALFVHLVSISLVSFLVPSSFTYLFLQLTAGIVTVVFIAELDKRSKFFFVVLFILLTYCLTYMGITLVQEGSPKSIDTDYFGMFAINAVLVLLAYPLIYLFERLFSLVTAVTLIELSDTNHPLLKSLASMAPGTFQHSIQVGNLAEEALRKIGGNALLGRTGSLYHDIGKIDMPLYFIENQGGGINPHESVAHTESARIIISHVHRGIEKARKNKLPEAIIDFIRTHHGTRTVDYFLSMHRQTDPDAVIDIEGFRYPGPNPYSRETGVVMMADSVEAASRSLRKPDADQVENLVDRIINRQVAEGYLTNSNLSLKDIDIAKDVFKSRLMAAFHIRIPYPE